MENKLLREIYESVDKGESVALAVITEELGSSPRKSGSMMAVWKDGKILGSVGGGKVEYTIINKAKECIEKKENLNFEYALNETDLGMQCGGKVKGYIKVFYPNNRLIIVGAGHIAENLNKLAKVLSFSTVIIDSREDYANKERFPDADEIIIDEASEIFKNYSLGLNDYVVIVSNSHEKDKLALKSVINKEVSYIGMIGSTKKIKYVMDELISDGIDENKLHLVYAPMGLDIGTGEPEEIAFSILSEILLIKNKGTLNHRRNLRKVWE